MQQAFRGRKHNPTQNMMAAVNFDLKFTYVLAGWEGSAHDALILTDNIERNDGFIVAQANSLACPLHLCPNYDTDIHIRHSLVQL
jgi:hypothetical protein